MTHQSKRQEAWLAAALEGELKTIADLPVGINIKKLGNDFWQSLYKIAGLVKAGYISQEDAFTKIRQASEHLRLLEREVDYQWYCACDRAQPRRLQE